MWYIRAFHAFYRRNYVPWCISNGVEWLFGVLRQEPIDPMKTVRSYRLPIQMVREGSRQRDLELLFKLLIIWVSSPIIRINQLCT
jgi:hypothetical protein